jgi:exodeoxyribonuclease VII large subunit
MTRATDSRLETISAGRLSQKIEEACSGQQYWVTGECKNARKSPGSVWRFDIVTKEAEHGKDENLCIIPCRILHNDARKIDGYLRSQGSSLSEALVDGMSLKVHGETNMWANSLQLRISRIHPDFLRTGKLHREQQEAQTELAESHPHNSRIRIPREEVHRNSDRGVPIPAARLERVMVIGPERSQGWNDFKFELGKKFNKSQDITYQSINWAADRATSRFSDLIHAASEQKQGLIVLVRGGGHWSGMQVFESKVLADLILNSDVPVVTAVGHYDDVSLADRAAVASFVTPSAAATAISRTYSAQWSKVLSARDQQKDIRTQENRQKSAQQIADLLEELAATKSEVVALRRNEEVRHRQHAQTLLEMARRRVRGYSRLATGLTVGLALAVFFGASGFLDFFGVEPTFPAVLITRCTAIIAAWIITWRLDIARQKIKWPAAKPLRVPLTESEWMSEIKTVRTVHRLRKLQRHPPFSAKEAEA